MNRRKGIGGARRQLPIGLAVSVCVVMVWTCGAVAGPVADAERGAGRTCEVDADCDDGVFCNGAEVCAGGACQSARNACAPLRCDEAAQVCLGGACVQPDGTCSDGLDATACRAMQQAHHEGLTCGQVLRSVVGACCFEEGVCFEDVDSEVCAAIGGSTLGDGLTCYGDPDQDGYVGCDDGCPLDPAKVEPGICGCGVSDSADEDVDSVPDCVDECPGTPPGEPVDENGCAALGACCFRGFYCVESAPAWDCHLVGGTYQGTGSACVEGCLLICNAEFDGDGWVDLDDHATFADCLAGPEAWPSPDLPVTGDECQQAFDFDADADVDLEDWAELQLTFGRECGYVEPECFVDEDCADGLFCNGDETCEAGRCENGVDPCASLTCQCEGEPQDPLCSEGDTQAECMCPDCAVTLEFTLGSDYLIGTAGDDLFVAELEFSPGAGRQVSQLQTGDSAMGLGGADVLSAKVNGTGAAAGTSTPTLTGIETLIFRVLDFNQTINATYTSGAETIWSLNSTNELRLTSLQENVDFGIQSVTGAGGTDIIDATFIGGVTSGTAEEFTLTLDMVNDGDFRVTTSGTSGFEVANIVSTGTADNLLGDFIHAGNTTLATANFTGSANLELKQLDAEITTIDASGMTGNLQLGDGNTTADFAGFAAYDNDMEMLTGGEGDDTFIFANELTTVDFSGTTEIIDGGPGTDTLQATLAGDFGSVFPILNVERLWLDVTANSSINLTGVAGLASVTLDHHWLQATLTLLNISGSPLPELIYRGNDTQAAQAYDAVTYNPAGTTGSSDTLNISVHNRGTALNTSGTANNHVLGAITVNTPAIENINFAAADGPATITTGISASGMVTATFTGSSNVTANTLNASGDTITSVNASAVAGNFTANTADLTTGASVILGAKDDSFTIADSGVTSTVITCGAGNDTIVSADADSADVIIGGAGTDAITGGGGIDTITGGADKDTFSFDATNVDATDADNITDFAAGANNDVVAIDVSAAGGGIAANLADAALVAIAASADNSFIVDSAGTGYATFALAEAAVEAVNGNTLDYALLFFNTTNNVVELHIDADSGAAGSNVLLASFSNQTTDALADAFLAAFVAGNYDSF